MAGVTRDRVAVPAHLRTEVGERWVEVVDTGGIGIVDRDDLGGEVEKQVAQALSTADVVLWLVDVREGITPLEIKPEACVGVVLCSAGYPGGFANGKPISGLNEASRLPSVEIFHAGTARDGATVADQARARRS